MPTFKQNTDKKTAERLAEPKFSAGDVAKKLDAAIGTAVRMDYGKINSNDIIRIRKDIEALNSSSRLNSTERRSIEQEISNFINKREGEPAEKIREELLGSIDAVKHGDGYRDSVKRVSEFADDILNFTESASLLRQDFSKLEESLKRGEQGITESLTAGSASEIALARDMKRINEVAAGEEIAGQMLDALLQKHAGPAESPVAEGVPRMAGGRAGDRFAEAEAAGQVPSVEGPLNRHILPEPRISEESGEAVVHDDKTPYIGDMENIGDIGGKGARVERRNIVLSAEAEGKAELRRYKEQMEENVAARLKFLKETVDELSAKNGNEIDKDDLKSVSAINVSLFAEINAYRNLLEDMQGSIEGRGLDPENEARKSSVSAINEVVEYLDRSSEAANDMIRKLGSDKNLEIGELRMSTEDIKELRSDMYNADKGAFLRLGTNLQGGPGVEIDNDKAIGEMLEDVTKLRDGLGPNSKVFLDSYDALDREFSNAIMFRLAYIEVLLDMHGTQNEDGKARHMVKLPEAQAQKSVPQAHAVTEKRTEVNDTLPKVKSVRYAAEEPVPVAEAARPAMEKVSTDNDVETELQRAEAVKHVADMVQSERSSEQHEEVGPAVIMPEPETAASKSHVEDLNRSVSETLRKGIKKGIWIEIDTSQNM